MSPSVRTIPEPVFGSQGAHGYRTQRFRGDRSADWDGWGVRSRCVHPAARAAPPMGFGQPKVVIKFLVFEPGPEPAAGGGVRRRAMPVRDGGVRIRSGSRRTPAAERPVQERAHDLCAGAVVEGRGIACRCSWRGQWIIVHDLPLQAYCPPSDFEPRCARRRGRDLLEPWPCDRGLSSARS